MKKDVFLRNLITIILMFSIIFGITPTTAQSINVTFDKTAYDVDSLVTMRIDLNGFSFPINVGVEVYTPTGSLVWVHQETATASPVWLSFQLPGNGIPEGTYTVYVAVESQSPETFTFLVKKPNFQIQSINAPLLPLNPGEGGVATVTIKNIGAQGEVKVQLYDENGILVTEVGPLLMGYQETRTVNLAFTAPLFTGIHNFTVKTFNIKYSTFDDQQNFTITTETTTPPPPPPPPPPTTTTTATTTTTETETETITATKPPEVVEKEYEADLSNYISLTGTTTNILITNPETQANIIIKKNTQITFPTGQPPKIMQKVPTQPPPAVNAILLGTPIEFLPAGTTFNPPITIEMHFNPSLVPEGYAVMLAYYDSQTNTWVPVKTTEVDMIRGIVRGEVSHFSIFAPVAIKTVTVVSPTTTTRTLTTTATVTMPTTITQTSTITTQKTTTTTQTTTVTAVPTTVTVTKTTQTTQTVQKTTTTTVKATEKQTITQTETVTKTPSWAYAAIIVAVIILVAAVFVSRR